MAGNWNPEETLQRREAFDYYYSLGANRTYKQVAERFQVSERTVNNWAKWFNWQERVRMRDIENSKKLEERTDKRIVDRKADMLKVVEHAIMGKGHMAEQLVKGDLKGASIKDLKMLVELALLLMGEVTERGEQRHGISGELRGYITDPEFLRAVQQAYTERRGSNNSSSNAGPVADSDDR